jgi:DNA-binding MarR family transcriptional regulator
VSSNYALWSFLERTAFAISRLREIELAPFGLTVQQAALLSMITRNEGSVTGKEVEQISLRQHHSISDLAHRLEDRGLIRKERTSVREGYRITMTEAARSLWEMLPSRSIDLVFDPLSLDDKITMIASLRCVRSKAKELLGGTNASPFMKQLTRNQRQAADAQDDPSTPVINYRVWALVDSTSFAVSRLRQIELSALGLTIEQSAFLRLTQDLGGSTTARVFEDFTLRQHHSVSTMIARMVKAGLLETRSTGERARTVFITERGKDILSRVGTTAPDMTLSVLDAFQKRRLTACLCAINERARAQLGVPGDPCLRD